LEKYAALGYLKRGGEVLTARHPGAHGEEATLLVNVRGLPLIQ